MAIQEGGRPEQWAAIPLLPTKDRNLASGYMGCLACSGPEARLEFKPVR